jgi:maltose O-acetyltransferase
MNTAKEAFVYRILKAFAFYFYNHAVTHIPSYHMRHFYLRYVLGIQIGKGSSMHMGCFITGNKIVIGTNTVINRNCFLDGRVGISIGDNVGLSFETYILSLTHDIHDPRFATKGGAVVLENHTWFGIRSIILPGVRVATGSVVGAGSVVTKDVPPYTIVGGVPAKEIEKRQRNLDYTLSYFPFFDTDIQ